MKTVLFLFLFLIIGNLTYSQTDTFTIDVSELHSITTLHNINVNPINCTDDGVDLQLINGDYKIIYNPNIYELFNQNFINKDTDIIIPQSDYYYEKIEINPIFQFEPYEYIPNII